MSPVAPHPHPAETVPRLFETHQAPTEQLVISLLASEEEEPLPPYLFPPLHQGPRLQLEGLSLPLKM